jgi:kinesin family protein 11
MSTKAVHQETVNIVDVQLEAMASQMAALDEFVARARQHNESNHHVYAGHIENLSTHVKSTFEDIKAVFENGNAQTLKADIQAQIAQLTGSIEPLGVEIRRSLQTLSSNVLSTSLTDYQPTGETPLKREWNFPSNLPLTILNTAPSSEPKNDVTSTPSRIKSPHKTPHRSPRKIASPRKAIKEVYVDSPAALPPPVQRSESARSLPSTSLKEIDLNTTNHTVSFPIEDVSDKLLKENERHPSRMQQPKQTRGKSVLSMSVVAGNEEIREAGKENFNPSKSVNAIYTGRRLRSSPLATE